MAINVVSVQYNGGFLPDIIPLNLLNAMKRFCFCSLFSHLNDLTFPPPISMMLRRFRFIQIFL